MSDRKARLSTRHDVKSQGNNTHLLKERKFPKENPQNLLSVTSHTLKKRHSAEANLDTPKPKEAPTLRAKSVQGQIEIDPDLCDGPDPSALLERFRKSRERKRYSTWVDRRIKCCYCEMVISVNRKCDCGHEFCSVCYRYDREPLIQEDSERWGEDIPDSDHSDIWKEVQLFVRASGRPPGRDE